MARVGGFTGASQHPFGIGVSLDSLYAANPNATLTPTPGPPAREPPPPNGVPSPTPPPVTPPPPVHMPTSPLQGVLDQWQHVIGGVFGSGLGSGGTPPPTGIFKPLPTLPTLPTTVQPLASGFTSLFSGLANFLKPRVP